MMPALKLSGELCQGCWSLLPVIVWTAHIGHQVLADGCNQCD